MKKLYILGLMSLAMGFTACEEDIEDPNGNPASNPQLEIVSAANVVVTPGPAAISLNDLNLSDGRVEVATVKAGEDWPEGFGPVVPNIEVSKTADFAEVHTIEATINDEGLVTVSPDDWEAAYLEMYGRNPKATKSYVRFPVWAVNGQQKVRMGGLDTYYGQANVEVTPIDLYNGRVIEEQYWLVNSFDNWDVSKAIPLHHSGKDVYVDAVFTSPTINVVGAGYEWLVISETARVANNLRMEGAAYGPVRADDPEGTLMFNVPDYPATRGVIKEAGAYVMTFDLEHLTYKVQMGYENLWTPGNSNGWGFGTAPLFTSDYTNYTGYAHLDGEFKFTTEPDWNGKNFGAGADPGTLDANGGNLVAPGNALYWCHVNLNELKYNLAEINTYGIVGSATPGGWDASTALTPSADFMIWSGTFALTAGELKFRANDGWEFNLGGTLDNLTPGGDNLQVAEDGTYVVTLDLSGLPYTATLQKQ